MMSFISSSVKSYESVTFIVGLVTFFPSLRYLNSPNVLLLWIISNEGQDSFLEKTSLFNSLNILGTLFKSAIISSNSFLFYDAKILNKSNFAKIFNFF